MHGEIGGKLVLRQKRGELIGTITNDYRLLCYPEVRKFF